MNYDLTSDADGTSRPPLPGISARDLRRVIKWSLPIVGVLFIFLALWCGVDLYTNWLWFDQLGFTGTFARITWFKSSLFIIGSAVTAMVLAVNFSLVLRFSRGQSVLAVTPDTMRLMVALVGAGAVLTILITSSVFGSTAGQRWEAFLLWFNRVNFGITDPVFGHDLSFYIVTLPVLNYIRGWLLALTITTLVASLALYISVFGLRGMNLVISPRMLKHLAGLGIALMLIIAYGHLLDRYNLVLSGRGIVYGATYTDITARVPVLWFLTIIALISAAGIAISPYYRGLRLMAGALSLWVILALALGVGFPPLFQRLQVSPNEFSREEEFIHRNITATRAAYQLDRIQQSHYQPGVTFAGTLTQSIRDKNQDTLDNIRLWDSPPLLDAYNQLQFMELYYNFRNVDSDRYTVTDPDTGADRLRQVLVAARELDSENLPADAQNWVNQRLQYTHGYGIAMSPANDFTPGEGRPVFSIPDMPIPSPPELYYGESDIDYAIVNTDLNEVNPISALTRYEGSGGVALSSTLRRIAYAWQLGDINILLSDHITGVSPDASPSRIQYRRQIRERVQTVAPFLDLDQDPYPVLDTTGKLWWLLDAYTTTSRYPYSTPSSEGFNYIRNSVKVTIDAYHGTVNLYIIDPDDPLIRMYQRAFPDLFQDILKMPADLRDHIRYPIGLYSTQAQQYLRYHIDDAQVFFNQAEQWALPTETRFGKTGVEVTPSYLMLQLPEQTSLEFVLLLPLTPAGEKKNLVAWLAARNDAPHYGELLAFQLPEDRQIDGPSQVEARIENDQSVSQQFTLWDGAGSRIIRGQLLAIPLADAESYTILYVEPLYLQSSGLAFPELKKVILATDNNLIMADTLGEGIDILLGKQAGQAQASEDGNSGVGNNGVLPRSELENLRQQASEIQELLDQAQESLKNLREALEGDTP
jgi:hypothetical protein